MNKKTYEKLPPETKSAMKENAMSFRNMAKNDYNKLTIKSKEIFIKADGQEIQWEPSTVAKFDEIYAPIWKDFIEGYEAKGIPARKYCEDIYNSFKELGAEKPALGYEPGKF